MGDSNEDPNYYIEFSGGTIDEERARQIQAATHAAFEWGATLPVEWNGLFAKDGAPALYAAMGDTVLAMPGVRALYETPAVALVFDPVTREVKGVRAQGASGEISIKARKGVILTTGDYANAPDLLSGFNYANMPIATCGTPADTGDGLRMAAAVGAKLEHMTNSSIDWTGAAFRRPTEEYGVAFYYNYGGMMEPEFAHGSKIVVNRAGNRFMNEEMLLTGLQHNRNAADLRFLDIKTTPMTADGDYEHMPMFMVMDSKVVDNEPLLVNEGKGWRCKHGVYNWSEDNQTEIERGWVLRADTLEELAGLMTSKTLMKKSEVSVDAAGLEATVEAFNEGCETGEDAFGRTVFDALDTPPYYAVELMPCVVYVEGGPAVDVQQRVLDWADQPIARLYAAGNVALGGELMPYGLAGCIGMGMDAGANSAALENWDA